MARNARGVNIRRILDQYGERAARAAREALKENAAELVNEAKERVPVMTGKLRASIHAEETRGGDRIKVTADAKDAKGTPYAAIVEYSPAINRPFLYPAFYALRSEMIERVKEKLRLELRRNV